MESSISVACATPSPLYESVFMQYAHQEANLALEEGEVPVGCVIVDLSSSVPPDDPIDALVNQAGLASQEKRIIARGRNATNKRHHALAHAEFVALEALMASSNSVSAQDKEVKENNAGPRIVNCALYVTVEPCLMCAAMLRYHQPLPGGEYDKIMTNCDGKSGFYSSRTVYVINHVFYGCSNPRFGGNGSVLALDVDKISLGSAALMPSYISMGGYMCQEAIELLQKFYERENSHAPGHKRRRKKES